MFVYENRASVILYNLLKETDDDKFFILPANVCPIVVTVLLQLKKKIKFIDISEKDLCLDQVATLHELIENPNKYSGVLYVRTYGVNDNLEKFFEEIKNIKKDLLLIDDRCLSIPAFNDELINADVNLYSTGYSKYVDIGFGGFAKLKDSISYNRTILNYRDEDLISLTKLLNICIREQKNIYYIDSDWLNTNHPQISFENYQNIVNNELLELICKKKHFNKIYSEGLPTSIQLPINYQNWRFNILVPEKDILLKKIFDAGLFASSHYAPASYLFDKNFTFQNAQNLYDNIINLFNDNRFSIEKIEQLLPIINNHVKQFQSC